MLFKIKCSKCGVEGSFSLKDPGYEGAYRCWKCRALFTLRLDNNELKSCEPLSEEEFERQHKVDALKKKSSRFNQ